MDGYYTRHWELELMDLIAAPFITAYKICCWVNKAAIWCWSTFKMRLWFIKMLIGLLIALIIFVIVSFTSFIIRDINIHKEIEANQIVYDAKYWDDKYKESLRRELDIQMSNVEVIHKWLTTNSLSKDIVLKDLNDIRKDIAAGQHIYYIRTSQEWDMENYYSRLINGTKDEQDLFFAIVLNGIVHGQVVRINSSGYSAENYIQYRLSGDSLKNYMNTLVNNALMLTFEWDYLTSQNDLYHCNNFNICDGFKDGEELDELGTLLDGCYMKDGYWININQYMYAKNNEAKLWWLSIDAYNELRVQYCEKYKYYDRVGSTDNTHSFVSSYVLELAYVENWTGGNMKLDNEFMFIKYDNILKIYNWVKGNM